MTSAPRTILLVEDNIVSATVEKISLEKEGFTIIHVTSGREAIDVVNSRERDIDLILLDIDLGPGMDGTETASLINKDHDIPTIFLSSFTEKKIVDKVSKIRSYGYITKNAGIDVLAASIRMALNLHTTQKELKKNIKTDSESERIYKLINDNLHDAFWIFDTNFKLTWVNPAVTTTMGFTFEELLDAPPEKIIAPESLEIARKCFRDNFSHENIYNSSREISINLELEFINKNGGKFWCDFSLTLIRTKEGLPSGYLGVGRNIDARKKSEILLRIQHDLSLKLSSTSDLSVALNTILDSALQIEGIDGGGIYLLDPNTNGFDLTCAKGLQENFIAQTSHFDQDSKSAKIAYAGKPVYLEYGDLIQQEISFIQTEKLRSLAVIPIFHADKIIASLNIASHVCDTIHINARIALETIASQVGDTIARIRATAALKESESNFRTMTENSMAGIYFFYDGKFRYFNPALLNMVGLAGTSFECIDPYKYIHPDDIESVKDRIIKKMAGEPITPIFNFRFVHKDGHVVHVEQFGTKISFNGKPTLVGNVIDISERIMAVNSLSKSLKENKTLLHELRHRVKNNLNVIVFLLQLEMDKLQNEETKKTFADAQSRIRSMSMLYDQMQFADDSGNTDLRHYIQGLSATIFNTYSIKPNEIAFNTDLCEIVIDMKRAFALGLFVNEAITNSLKHAFPGNRRGNVKVFLERHDEMATLGISDDGIGGIFDIDSGSLTGSLGIELMKIISSQIEGKISVESSPQKGTTFKITFLI